MGALRASARTKFLAVRPYIMGVLREDAYQNKPSVLLSTDAYLYRRGA
jgi:hypothetical protein